MLDRSYHDAIYAIYGFVRYADEIVDTFHSHDKAALLAQFRADTQAAIAQGLSLNPILHSFQQVVRRYGITWDLIDAFLISMEMDLEGTSYSRDGYDTYIYGSAEVVGLMCLRVFVEGDEARYRALEPGARRLGAAFQKINFLRDVQADYLERGRVYFPNVDLTCFGPDCKAEIEAEIQADFAAARRAIVQLPRGARLGVYVAYVYYKRLFQVIQRLPAQRILQERVRVPDTQKVALLFGAMARHSLLGL
jgi:phytoene/squalene synthetase